MAKQFPKIYYGLHFVPGLAEYKKGDGESERIYISEEVAKKMDKTFSGKPVYVDHVGQVDLSKIEQADGYVVKSFFNKADGLHWAEFMAVTDKAHEAIQKGWKLSNAYIIEESGPAGKNHNVDYNEEVLNADYQHLAIVQVPRYEESVILTPEQFREYCHSKENSIKNSKEELKQETKENSIKETFKMKFNFFTRKAIENGDELANTHVLLENGSEVTVKDLIDMANKKNADDKEMEKKEEEKKNADEEAKKKEEEEKKNKKNEEDKKEEAKEEKKENSDDKDEDDKKENEDKEKEEKEDKKNKKNSLEDDENMKIIENAMNKVFGNDHVVVETSMNKLQRGKALYGSN